MDTITHEQQIKSQAEALKQLSKKVDALKLELENATGKVRAAGKTKIEIQSYNDDNIDDFKIHCFKMQEALSGLLHINENQEGRYGEFAMLRDQLLCNPEVSRFHHEKDFNHAILILSRVTDRMIALRMLQWVSNKEQHRDIEFGAKAMGSENTFHFRYWQSIPRIIMGANDANDKYQNYSFTDNLQAFALVQKCLPCLQKSLASNFSEINIYIDTIVFYLQKIVDQFEVKWSEGNDVVTLQNFSCEPPKNKKAITFVTAFRLLLLGLNQSRLGGTD